MLNGEYPRHGAKARAAASDGQGSTHLALLGTIGSLHGESPRYNLAHLRSLVETLEPDLLGVEVAPQDWIRGELSGAPIEIQGALAPAARRTNTVIIPLGAPSALELAPPAAGTLWRLRAALVRWSDGQLLRLQRAAGSPEAVNGALFGHLCALLCILREVGASAAGRHAWEQTNECILHQLLTAVRRDPGRRMLVAVNCRRVHWLRARLQPLQDEIRLVPYADLCHRQNAQGSGAHGNGRKLWQRETQERP